MKVQAHHNGTVHVFEGGVALSLATLYVSPPLKSEVDKRLHKFRLFRKKKWADHSWGSEADFYFRGMMR